MTIALSYDTTLSRVQIDLSGLVDGTVQVQRVLNASATDALWSQGIVRGGRALAVQSGAAVAHDAEFFADVANHYRVLDESETVVESDSITPGLDGQVWLKSIAYPSLNTVVRVADYGTVGLVSRSAAFGVSGRSLPLGVTDHTGGRDHPLVIAADDVEAAAKVEAIVRTGGVLFVHVPTVTVPGRDGNVLLPGSMYLVLPDVASVERLGGVSEVQHFVLPVTEVAKPGPDVVGTTLTWGTVERLYGSWEALVAAHPTWRSALASVGDPGDLFEP